MKLNNNDDSHNSGLNLLIYNMLLDIESHPAWVCGLKRKCHLRNYLPYKSHPAWVCGLKQGGFMVTGGHSLSHPAWVCGLKLRWVLLLLWIQVTPCVGVWIETFITNKYNGARIVTPCVGVWIETERGAVHEIAVVGHTLRGCVD